MTGHSTLYVSDLDGTLLNSSSELSCQSIELLNKVIKSGANFTVATARTPATISRLLQNVDIKMDVIAMTGAVFFNCSTEEYSNPKFIDSTVAKHLFQQYKDEGLPVFIYTLSDNKIEVLHYGQLSELEKKFIAERDGTPYKQFNIPDNGCSDIPSELNNVLLFYTMQPSSQVASFYEKIKDNVGINPIFYHDIFGQETGLLEVFSDITSKAASVENLASRINADRIIVFGDNLNDLPMMKKATHAVAVENAIEEVRNQADEIIGSNNSNSVALYILNDFSQIVVQ